MIEDRDFLYQKRRGDALDKLVAEAAPQMIRDLESMLVKDALIKEAKRRVAEEDA